MRTGKKAKDNVCRIEHVITPELFELIKIFTKKRIAFCFKLKNADGKSIIKNGIVLIPFFSFLAFANTNARDDISFSFKQGGSIKKCYYVTHDYSA